MEEGKPLWGTGPNPGPHRPHYNWAKDRKSTGPKKGCLHWLRFWLIVLGLVLLSCVFLKKLT